MGFDVFSSPRSGPPTAAVPTRIDTRDRIANVALSGELDLSTAPALTDLLVRLGSGTDIDAIILDLRDVTFLDCSGLHLFLDLRARTTTGAFRVVAVGAIACVRRVFVLTGTEELLDGGDAAGLLARFTKSKPRIGAQVVDLNVGSEVDADA